MKKASKVIDDITSLCDCCRYPFKKIYPGNTSCFSCLNGQSQILFSDPTKNKLTINYTSMNTTATESLEEQLKHFISSYRLMEKSTFQYGYKVIKDTLLPDENTKLFNHLCDHWKGKKKGFGQWFLNVSHEKQIKILQYWNITSPADQEYLDNCQADPTFYFFADPPELVNHAHELLLFFENNGIYQGALPSLEISSWPKKPKDFGNSANWADFILSSGNPELIIKSILHL